jgi:pimeloyl-ACP methyl ester carboxylesterase
MNENSLRQYQDAERSLWDYYGAQPKDHFLQLEQPRLKVRVQEVGQGDPVLFVHGGPNAGTTWAPLVAKLLNFRCLVLDRPGCGLSEPVDYSSVDFRSLAVDVLDSVLDGLGIEQLPLVVSSLGGAWGFWLAQARPQRVSRIVQMGCPALVDGMQVPIFMRLLSTRGLNRLMMRIQPASLESVRAIYRQIGHSASLDAGRIPEVYFEWSCHLMQDTETMRWEVSAIERAATWAGIRSELRFAEKDFSQIAQPTLFLWGEDDPFGGTDLGRRTVAAMPDASLRPFPKSGHLPWLDDPETLADLTQGFLSAESV